MKSVLVNIVILLFLFSGCSIQRPTKISSEEEVAAVYNPSEITLNTEYKVYHNSDTRSTLYIRLFPIELLFNQANEDAEFMARVALDMQVYELSREDDGREKIDSASIEITLGKEDMNQSAFFSSLILPLQLGKSYLLELRSRDQLRGSFGLKYLYVDKTDDQSAQNFNVVNAANGTPKFRNYFLDGEVFRLLHKHGDFDTLYIDVLKEGGDYPKPPVAVASPSIYPYLVDTTLIVSYSETRIYTLPGAGVFHLRYDTTRQEGLTLMNMGNRFPQVRTEDGLLEPLYYIATNSEYDQLRRSSNTKLAVDDFWLNRNSSMERSRELIRIYYNRVVYSNIYFTSDREGWRTDRGMVYVLFGPPDRMLDVGSYQIWYYISSRRNKVIQFKFLRKPTIYTNDHFIWEKDFETMGYWNEAVRTWRKGTIFSLTN
jgi:GWxTD domain-containing protein